MNESTKSTDEGSRTGALIAILTWWFRSWHRPAGSISRWQHEH